MIQFEDRSPAFSPPVTFTVEKENGSVRSAVKLDELRPLRGDTLAIVGFAETSRHLTPFDDEDVEVWICNRLGLQPGVTRWDRHFDPHPLDWSKANHVQENWDTYEEWLKKDYGDRLIYLPRRDDSVCPVPNAVSFPKDEVVAHVKRPYFSSAIGWQLGLALLLHDMYGSPKKIGLWGIDLRGLTEYEYQRPNAEWLLGIAQGRGIEILLPEKSALLNEDTNDPLYGFELYSGGGPVGEIEKGVEESIRARQALLADLQKQNDALLVKMHTENGALQAEQHLLTRIMQRRRGGVF